MSNLPKSQNKKIYLIVQLLSLVIAAALVWLIYFQTGPTVGISHWSKNLPSLNAFLNTMTSCLLIFGYIQIKKGHKETHKKVMMTAVFVSVLFLVSYVTYHFDQGDTKFMGTGLLRISYFFILITHIILSIVNLPLVLLTLWFALTEKHEKHKKFARITFPIWLYVSATGVLVYLFLKFLNPGHLGV